jgi:hypothetical protein
MRKLLTFLIALAAAAFAVYSPASADTIKYSFDSGRQLPTAWGLHASAATARSP